MDLIFPGSFVTEEMSPVLGQGARQTLASPISPPPLPNFFIFSFLWINSLEFLFTFASKTVSNYSVRANAVYMSVPRQ